MSSPIYNAHGSTRNHFVEPPSLVARAVATLPNALAVPMQRMLQHCSNTSSADVHAKLHSSLRLARRAWTLRRILSVPHLLVALWVLVLLWGERWTFQSSIAACKWENWEKWPKDASPHHVVFVADPQLVDPHTYPDRPWPLSTFTRLHTDNYIKRSYIQLQTHLQPDTLFFLGDLFDGGREWKTERGDSRDPAWAEGSRPASEQAYLGRWRKKYGDTFWLREYDRFGRIFYDFWSLGESETRPYHRGRKIISSLPGNHDLGFGAQIRLSVRDRFETYFGEGNRVDVVGNHTVVSVDTVSLSAGASDHNIPELTRPVREFLSKVQTLKRKAVARELGFQAGHELTTQYSHRIEDLDKANFHLPSRDPGPQTADFPTVLLTHVPLYRGAGTPCGPNRERWGPTPPPKGQTSPVVPDERNAISISSGYQYQNVLSEVDSVKLVSTIGNVVSVFSGDDHDYCEIVHPSDKNHAREITVKSISWAMGVRRPGFVMVSMWNPIDPDGKPLHPIQTSQAEPAASATMENHLCLLPDQLSIFIRYGIILALTLLTLLARALLVPLLNLTPFSAPLDLDSPLLPASTRDLERDPAGRGIYLPVQSSTSSTCPNTSANLAPRPAAARTRTGSPAAGYGLPASQARNATPPLANGAYAGSDGEKKHDAMQRYGADRKKKQAAGGVLGLVWREAWMSVWRVAWMVLGVYFYLVWYG